MRRKSYGRQLLEIDKTHNYFLQYFRRSFSLSGKHAIQDYFTSFNLTALDMDLVPLMREAEKVRIFRNISSAEMLNAYNYNLNAVGKF